MLMETTRSGTARRAFRARGGRPLLGEVRVAGKTGSLSGRDPDGRYEWFIGVAPADDPRIAVHSWTAAGHADCNAFGMQRRAGYTALLAAIAAVVCGSMIGTAGAPAAPAKPSVARVARLDDRVRPTLASAAIIKVEKGSAHHGALVQPAFKSLRRCAAHKKLPALRLDRRAGKLCVSGELLGILDFTVRDYPIGLRHSFSPVVQWRKQ
jgi:hypothetical protein